MIYSKDSKNRFADHLRRIQQSIQPLSPSKPFAHMSSNSWLSKLKPNR